MNKLVEIKLTAKGVEKIELTESILYQSVEFDTYHERFGAIILFSTFPPTPLGEIESGSVTILSVGSPQVSIQPLGMRIFIKGYSWQSKQIAREYIKYLNPWEYLTNRLNDISGAGPFNFKKYLGKICF